MQVPRLAASQARPFEQGSCVRDSVECAKVRGTSEAIGVSISEAVHREGVYLTGEMYSISCMAVVV